MNVIYVSYIHIQMYPQKHTSKNVDGSIVYMKRIGINPKGHWWRISSAAAAAKSLQPCRTLCDPIDDSLPGPPSLGFSRQEHWSGLPFPSPMHENERWKWSRSVVSDCLPPHGLQPTRLLCPWDFPGKRTGVGCHCLLLCCPKNKIFGTIFLDSIYMH